MEKHFVRFYYPGTFVSDTAEKPIESWDINIALDMLESVSSQKIPYGFMFITRERADDELDSHESEKSGTYYLGGEVLALEQIKARNDPKDKILISNMEGNNWERVVVNTNSWKITLPLEPDDTILDHKPKEESIV